MSKLDLSQQVPADYDRGKWTDILRAICGQVNPLSEGRLSARYNSQSSVPTGGSVSYAVGDFIADSNTTVTNGSVRLGWVCTTAGTPGTFQEARVLVAHFGQLSNSLGADVSLNNTSNYFDGPTISQGTSGTWWVSGTVCLADTGGSANFSVKLWDGTTVIDSAVMTTPSTGASVPVSLSGYINSPAGNLRISAKDTSRTTGLIVFNGSGNSKDSTISAIRIG